MDADNKCRYLNDADFREVFSAVFNHLRDGVEPKFENYLLYDYYEKVLSTPMFYLSKIDGRSVTSAENGKKGGRPKKYSITDDDSEPEYSITEYIKKIPKKKYKFSDTEDI